MSISNGLVISIACFVRLNVLANDFYVKFGKIGYYIMYERQITKS